MLVLWWSSVSMSWCNFGVHWNTYFQQFKCHHVIMPCRCSAHSYTALLRILPPNATKLVLSHDAVRTWLALWAASQVQISVEPDFPLWGFCDLTIWKVGLWPKVCWFKSQTWLRAPWARHLTPKMPPAQQKKNLGLVLVYCFFWWVILLNSVCVDFRILYYNIIWK